MKEYTLQDAKEEYAQQNGFKDWQTILHALDSYDIVDAKDAIAELYASKVTEELRKDLNDAVEAGHQRDVHIVALQSKIERLKESNKELVEALHKIASRGKGVLRKIAHEALAKKSEGDVNK